MLLSDIDFPVLRLQRDLTTEVIALYETHLLLGSLRKPSLPLTEEMCHAAGEEALAARLRHRRRIELADVALLRERRRSRKTRISIATQDGSKVSFKIPSDQMETLRDAFSALLGSRAQVAAPAATASSGSAPVAAKRSPPAYSPITGWLLKILGVLYWIAIASPLTDGIPTSNRYLWALLWLPAPMLIARGYRLCSRRYEPQRDHDLRKPVLFLRPFEDDLATTLQPLGMFADLTGARQALHPLISMRNTSRGGRAPAKDLLYSCNPILLLRMIFNYGATTCEESLLRYFEAYGPVVAVGRPGGGAPVPGSQRIYLEDGEWQERVRSEIQRAQIIVLQPGVSTGINWELDQVRQHAEAFKLLLCLVSFWANPQEYEKWRALAKKDLGADLPRVVPYLDRPVFLYFDRNWQPHLQPLSYRCPAWWPIAGDATDLRYVLQPFMEGVFGGDREPPRPPRWAGGFRTFAAGCVGIVLALVVALGPVMGVHWATQAAFGTVLPNFDDELEIAHTVDGAPRTILRSDEVGFQVTIPEALVPMDASGSGKIREQVRSSPDKHFILEMAAVREHGNFSELPQQRLAVLRKLGCQAKLVSVRTVQQGGVAWTEARSMCETASGAKLFEIARAVSAQRGSVILVETLLRGGRDAAIYQTVADRILLSSRFDS